MKMQEYKTAIDKKDKKIFVLLFLRNYIVKRTSKKGGGYGKKRIGNAHPGRMGEKGVKKIKGSANIVLSGSIAYTCSLSVFIP